MSQGITVILGGGTFTHVRNHLALAAPAFGTTARKISDLLNKKATMYLTKMASPGSDLVTNQDVSNKVDELIRNKNVKCIYFNVAMCDFNGTVGSVTSGKHADRLKSSSGEMMCMTPAEKVISKIRVARPDIFLIGFKTTTRETVKNQFAIGLEFMKRSKCNLVLANDTVTRMNMVITPEESAYEVTGDRDKALKVLTTMAKKRLGLTYHRTVMDYGDSYPVADVFSETMFKVLKYVVTNGGYICNNGNGFTPGHFSQKVSENAFYSSQRKADHNLVFKEGVTRVEHDHGVFFGYGRRKPSVGARSQFLMFERHPEYDCIIHTHNPIKEDSKIRWATQLPYQCGSEECGINTVENLGDYDGIKAVFLEKHGTNILFKSSDDPNKIIKFIQDNIVLGEKIGI